MRLQLKRLREARIAPGTPGTAGTSTVYRGSGVPAPFPLVGTPGTAMLDGAPLFPLFPLTKIDREQEICSIDAAVPVVPAVPTPKSVSESAACRLELAACDSEAWDAELDRWAKNRCVFRDRAWGGLAALHRDYVDWSHATGHIPPATLPTFRLWVAEQGFTIAGALVYGLVLAVDLREGNTLTPEHQPVTACVLPMRPRRVQ